MLARTILILAFLICIISVARAEDKPPAISYLSMGSEIQWKVGALADQYAYTDQQNRAWTITLKTQGKPKYLRMTVKADGIKPVSTSFDLEDAADYGAFGVYDFDAGMPVFLMTDYSMGAHCCTDVKAVLFNGQKLVAVDGGSYDGAGIWVRDLDGDGTYEIEGWDQRFYYAFDSYAGSLPARQILKLREKGPDDVTANPEYQAYMTRQANQWASQCYENPSPGACAGALGTAAKAGLYQSVAADVLFKKIDADNKGAEYLACPAARCGVDMKFWNYREALEFQLNDWGYNTDSSMSDAGRAYFRKLAAFPKGFATQSAKNAAACSEDAVKVTIDKTGQFAQLEGHEYSCRIEKANILGNAAVSLGLCAGEGETSSALVVTEFQKDKLYISFVYDGAVDSGFRPEAMSACP